MPTLLRTFSTCPNRGLVQDTSKVKKSTTGAKVKAKDRSGHGALR